MEWPPNVVQRWETSFYPLVGISISAHEISHGFTQKNSKLQSKGQSGAINEAFSDIAGVAAKFYRYHQADFSIGGEIMKTMPAARYLDEPSKDG